MERPEQATELKQQKVPRETARILVVEDEPLILMSTVDMVSELGHTVHEACSAEDALAVLETHQIDVLLTDVGLRGMSGTDLARQARERWPAMRIVFASGDDSAKTASGIPDALQLSKPFTIDGLAKVLSALPEDPDA
jgi:CheY-like chemotaxis protein